MKYVLIFVLMTGAKSSAMTAEFSTLQKCQQVILWLNETQNKGIFNAGCFEQ